MTLLYSLTKSDYQNSSRKTPNIVILFDRFHSIWLPHSQLFNHLFLCMFACVYENTIIIHFFLMQAGLSIVPILRTEHLRKGRKPGTHSTEKGNHTKSVCKLIWQIRNSKYHHDQ